MELVEDEVEEVEEEVSLPDLGRERARNLTTDLLQYLVGHMRTASFRDDPK